MFTKLGAGVFEAAPQVVQLGSGLVQPAPDQARQAGFKRLQPLSPLSLVRTQQLRCRRRGCRPLVGDHVSDGEIHLVADGRDNREFAGRDGAGDYLLVKRPQILQ